MRRVLPILLALAGCATPSLEQAAPAQRVHEAETAFAATMADRDLDAFAEFVADEAVFVQAGGTLRGRQAIVDGWRRFFDGPDAPFSWRPVLVEVLDSGRLALSTGPVYDASGNCTGTFTSIWRLEGDGRWRVIFDRGNPTCGER